MDISLSSSPTTSILRSGKECTYFRGWLLVSFCGLFGASLLFLGLVYPPGVRILILASLGIALVVVLFRQTHKVILSLLFLGPFTDILITLFFSNIPLVGTWKDLIVAGIVVKGIWLAMSPDFQWRFSWLDCAVCIFILEYALSIVLTPNLAVWLYGFRWYAVYAFLYLALKAYRFTARELSQVLMAAVAGLLLSAIIGFGLLQFLGEGGFSLIWQQLFKAGDFWREGHFRWPGTFPNPITASTGFALLLIVSLAHLLERKLWGAYIPITIAGAYALFITYSRSGWLVATVGLIVMVLMVGKQFHARKTVIVVLLLAVVSSIVAVSLNPEVLNILTQKNEMDNYRLQTFEIVLSGALVHPFGVGVGTAGAMALGAQRFGGSSAVVDPVVGDSVLFAVLRDTGWIGMFSLIAISVGFIINSYKGFRSAMSKEKRVFALAGCGYSVGLLANLMNGSDVWPVAFYLWLFGALTVAMVEGRIDGPKNTSGSPARIIIKDGLRAD